MNKHTSMGFPDTEFWRRYSGAFKGVLHWQDFDALFARIATVPDGWYVFDPTQTAPVTKARADELARFLEEARALLDRRRDQSHCGLIYVDDPLDPTFVKLFDPAKLGSSCSVGGAPILPKWVLSQMRPDTLPASEAEKPGLFRRVFGG